MKLPRWLLWGMVSCTLFSALAAAGWWWVTWPERTVMRFLARQVGGSIESITFSRKSFRHWVTRQADVEVKTRYATTHYRQVYEVERNRIRCIETQFQEMDSSETKKGFASGLWNDID